MQGNNNHFNFKDTINELERICKDLESEDIDLEIALKKYEHGISLIRKCSQYLEEAEIMIKELEMGDNQTILTEDSINDIKDIRDIENEDIEDIEYPDDINDIEDNF